MKLVKFNADFFDGGHVKYRRGHHYEANEDTRIAVAQGHAEEVDARADQVVKPFVDPRTIDGRKAELRRIISQSQAELDELEAQTPAAADPDPASKQAPKKVAKKSAQASETDE